MRQRVAVVALPLAVGLLVALAARLGLVANPLLYLRADLLALAPLLGAAGSLGVAAALGARAWGRRRERHGVARAHAAATEERRRFLRRLDHELKNPLTAIRAGLANVADSPDGAARGDALASVEAQVLRLSRLVADLRKLAELESRPLERGPVEIGALLEEALAAARERPEAEGRRLTLTLPQAPWPLPTLSGDWDLLFLATHNLLDNALKFSEPGDALEVRAFESDSAVVIEVADTGPGIAAADLPHVWEELYRAEAARGVPGSGLGLALVRAIAERHGGAVTMRSRAAQGTVVTLQLPVAPG